MVMVKLGVRVGRMVCIRGGMWVGVRKRVISGW